MVRFGIVFILMVALYSQIQSEIVVGTGFSVNNSATTAATEASQQAKTQLGGTQADVVIIWDSVYGGYYNQSVSQQILNTVINQFPGAVVCGQSDGSGYSGYTEDGITIDTTSICIIAIGGDVTVKAEYVTGVRGDMDQATLESKGAELANKLVPLPSDLRMIIVMGVLHNPGMTYLSNGMKTVIPANSPVIGGASSDWGGLVYASGSVHVESAIGIMLSGNFGANFALDIDQYSGPSGEAAVAQETINALPVGATKKGLIWFNCASRAAWPVTQQDRDNHLNAVKNVMGTTPIWGHWSGHEIGKESNTDVFFGQGGMAAMGLLYDGGSVTPTITVTYPNGGETWTVGTTQTITWTSQGSVGNVNIDLSTNGGTNWTNLVSNTVNDGSQTVTVPNTPSSTCRVRVQEPDGSPSDTSNNNFTISAPVQPTITVTAPNGGETWQTGTTQTVLWSSQGSVGNVNIDLSTDGGTNWTNLVSNTANDGSQTVTVPNTPSSTCRIRVREPDGTPSDISDNNFTISTTPPPPGITVVYPNGGEIWTVGETRTVQWTSQGSVGNVNIDLSTNSGSTWTTLVSNTANDGSQTITVPNTPSSTCRIRVQEPDGSPSDISNSNFTIQSGGGPTEPIISVSTTVLDFGTLDAGQTATLTFAITNTGSGTLTGTLITDSDWITVDPPSFFIPAQAGIQTINVTVDNSILNKTEGQYTGTITITSNGGTATVDVIVTATCVLVKPNPYNPNKGLLTFFGSGIVPGETTIKIYTLSGELVKDLSAKTDELVWDGKTENGEPVTSGIYLYTYYSPKEKGIGKFTVIIK